MEYQPLSEFGITPLPLLTASTEQRRYKSALYDDAQRSTVHEANLQEKTQFQQYFVSLPGQLNSDKVTEDDITKNSKYLCAPTSMRSRSASHAQCSHDAELKTQLAESCTSLPAAGQRDAVTKDISQSAKFLADTPMNAVVSDDCEMSNEVKESTSTAVVEILDRASQKSETQTKSELNNSVPTADDLERELQEQSCSEIEMQRTSSLQSLSNSSILINDEANVDDEISLSGVTTPSDSIEVYKQTLIARQSKSSNTKPVTFVLYILCAIIVYPLLVLLIPFLLTFKLVSLLCCCIPCFWRKHTATKQEFPLFFTSHPGGFHTIGIELRQQMDGENFVEYVASTLSDIYDHNTLIRQKTVVFRLASIIRWRACFSWWELREKVKLEEHIHIVRKRVTTKTNFADFIEELSRKESTRRLWQVYFFPLFKVKGSCIVLKIHHSVLAGIGLKDVLFDGVINMANGKSTFGAELAFPRPMSFNIALTAPGIVLKHLLQPSLSLVRTSKKFRYVYSSPMHLNEACHVANFCSVSLHALLMAPLSQSLRNILSEKYPFRRVRVAIPVVSSDGHNSAFFVNLPLTRQPLDIVQLQRLDKEIYRSSTESHVLLSAAKLASLALSPCIVNLLASTILRGADMLFHIVHCPENTQYLDDSAISSTVYWPPLFNNISMGVTVVVYERSFRVCVVTDCGVTEWPDILLKQFVANYSEIFRSFSV